MPKEKEKEGTYRIKGSAFKFKKVVYPEGSLVKMTESEYQREKGKITLIPVEEPTPTEGGTNG